MNGLVSHRSALRRKPGSVSLRAAGLLINTHGKSGLRIAHARTLGPEPTHRGPVSEKGIFMKQYPDEFKASIITKLLAPNNADIPALAIESGIPKDTLYSWRIKHRRRDQQVKAQKTDDNNKINSSEKFDDEMSQFLAFCENINIDIWRNIRGAITYLFIVVPPG
jgi:transposase-like protein